MGDRARRWVKPEPVEAEAVRDLQEELGLRRELAEILVRRGRAGPDAARRWLRPRLSHLHPAELLPDLEPAVACLEEAVERGDTILVHGDYDADGMAAAALLTRGLRELGGRVEAFVPHRTEHGYDLGEPGLRRAEEAGARVVLTADCGTTAGEAVAAARSRGMEVVVTDHHRAGSQLPPARAVVNPTREDSRYPFPSLSGAGVAFKLLSALYRRAGRPRPQLNQHLDLVAVGTVADVVPLVDENRVLVRAGLAALGRTRKPGLKALLEAAGVGDEDAPTAGVVGYRLGPRLNAVGRMADAETGLRLLLTEDPAEAGRHARELEEQNRRRRTADRRVEEAALSQLRKRYDPEEARGVVLWAEDWHPGVVGLAASRVVERIHRPAVLVSFRDGELGRGSGRSVAGFHLHGALAECESLLERFGGHRLAAGLRVRRSNVEELARRFQEVAARELEDVDLEPELSLDLRVSLGDVDLELHRWLEYLAPFGSANPRPLLLAEDVRFQDAARVGSEGDHLKGALASPEARVEAIGFGLGDRAGELRRADRFDVAFEVTADRWRGRRRLQARVRDFRPAGAERAP